MLGHIGIQVKTALYALQKKTFKINEAKSNKEGLEQFFEETLVYFQETSASVLYCFGIIVSENLALVEKNQMFLASYDLTDYCLK